MGVKSAARKTLRSVRFVILAIVIVVILAVAAILLIEFNPYLEDTPPTGREKENKNEKQVITTVYCNKDKAANEVCDGVKDCVDGRDEAGCRVGNGTVCSKFRCGGDADEYLCLPKDVICDGTKDCLDGLDETNCDDDCDAGMFLCPLSSKDGDMTCIDHEKVCDRVNDCPNATDETGCARWVGWSHWCRNQIANDPKCLLRRERQCRYGNEEIIQNPAVCALLGLKISPHLTLEDFFQLCENVKEFDPYSVQLCPEVANQTSSNANKPQAARSSSWKNNSQSKDSKVSPGPKLSPVPDEDPEVMLPGQATSSRHVYSVIIGCCAFVLCVILAVSLYCTVLRHQYRTYNVAKRESNGALPSKVEKTPEEGEEKRVSTSSTV